MEEPSVLDFIKSKLFPWKYPGVELSEGEPEEEAPEILPSPLPPLIIQEAEAPAVARIKPVGETIHWPWRSLLALILALAGQGLLQPPERHPMQGIVIYIVGAALLVWGALVNEWAPVAIPEGPRVVDALQLRRIPFLAGIAIALLAFLFFGKGDFTTFNVILWAIALALILLALWQGRPALGRWFKALVGALRQPRWNLTISRWTLLLVAIFSLSVFFRAYQLEQVPPEMNSDHAEKLLDVQDVLKGETHIYFPRNTGREAFQFYLTAAVIKIFNTGITFLSLKIGTLLVGLMGLVYIYLLGKEVGNRKTGLFAMALAGIAYWPNVLSRIGLRFILYPAFVAPTLYYLVRGLRTSNRNDFILSGIALGIGLHGYTPIRILPIVIVIAIGLFLLHSQSKGMRKQTLVHLCILAFVSLVIFLPLLRYALEEPEMFAYRSFTRLGELERPLPGPWWLIFLNNLWRAMIMFGWDNGNVWVVSIPGNPALDLFSATLFYFGMILLLVRYLRRRHWLDLFLMLSVPLLLLPSILSLAFPDENPILNRTAGAMVPVFLIAGIALEGFYSAIRRTTSGLWAKRAAWGATLLIVCFATITNYDLVFKQYDQQYRLSAWNTSEMGQVIQFFAKTVGSADTAWVVAYPHWVDTRLVGINAGFPSRDYAISKEELESTVAEPRAKLFLAMPEDQEGLAALQQLYPQGSMQLYKSKVETKDFWVYFVPPTGTP